jgi:uncharacterized protein (TIGR02145 family)
MKKIIVLTTFLFLLISCSSNDDSDTVNPSVLFSLGTYSVNNIGHQSAAVFGVFNPSLITQVSEYGICYGLSPNPNISGTHIAATNVNTDSGGFSSNLSPLSQNTTYYVRAYGTTSNGTFYGDQITFSTLSQLYTNASTITDIDGNTYPSIIINTNQWMKENLNVSKYRNGDVIPEVTDITEWDNLTTGAWCYYANDTANGTTYGKLYNWYAVNDARGLAPTGWHIPTDQEWTSLTTFLGGTSVAGTKMRDTGTLWSSTSQVATNQSGFSALPGGYSYLTTIYTPAGEPFIGLGDVAFWWSATSSSTVTAYSVNVSLTNSLNRSSIRSKAAISVRCVKN